jgi:hypothetical protein
MKALATCKDRKFRPIPKFSLLNSQKFLATAKEGCDRQAMSFGAVTLLLLEDMEFAQVI